MSSQLPSFAIANLRHPSEGAKAVQVVFPFAIASQFAGDFFLELEDGKIDFIQSIKIDNSQNPDAFTILFPGIGNFGDRIVVAPYSQSVEPLFVPVGKVSYIASSLGSASVPVTFFNIPMPYYSKVCISTAPVSTIVTGTATAHSAAIANANMSQIAIPANANRLRAIIQNPPENAASFWVREGTGNAATEDYNSIEIAPGQSYDTSEGPLQLGDINIIAAVVQDYYANEIHS